jgi:hypothetical protein
MTAYRGNLKVVRYRDKAVPYDTEADALAAIMQHKVDDPGGAYSVRQYPDGFYILTVFSAGGACWLTEATNG